MMMIRGKHIAVIGSGPIGGGGVNSWETLWAVNVNTAAGAAVLKLYNGVSTAGELMATIDASAKCSFVYGTAFKDGIFYDLSGGNADITVSWE